MPDKEKEPDKEVDQTEPEDLIYPWPTKDPYHFYIKIPRKRKETYEEVLRSVALISLIHDLHAEQLGLMPPLKQKVTVGKRNIEIVFDAADKLDAIPAKIAQELSEKYPTYESPMEWRRRLKFYQPFPFDELKLVREDLLVQIRQLKHIETVEEIIKAFDYLKNNFPRTDTPLAEQSLETKSKDWLNAMLKLKEAKFSYYAAQHAADRTCFIFDKEEILPYGYYDKTGDRHANLPSTWDEAEIKAWRDAEAAATKEKEQLDQEVEDDKKQREQLKPYLTDLIVKGWNDIQIHAQLCKEKKPRQLIKNLMSDVGVLRYIRQMTAGQRKPLKVEVTISDQKPTEKPEPTDHDKLIKDWDAAVWKLFPYGLTDQEIFDRLSAGSHYEPLLIKDTDLMKGRIRILRQQYNAAQAKPVDTTQKERATIIPRDLFRDMTKDLPK